MIQSSRKFARSGRPRRRKRRLSARPMTSASELRCTSTHSSSAWHTTAVLLRPPSMVRCVRLLGCQANSHRTPSFHLLGTSQLPLAHPLLLSTALTVPAFRRAWHSMLPTMHTTVPVVTPSTVIPSRLMARTLKCTSKVISKVTDTANTLRMLCEAEGLSPGRK